MTKLPIWMRRVLFATAVMNILAAAAFLPAAGSLRVLVGFPPGEHPIYLLTVAMFVLLFGLAYLWAATTGRADHLFIAVAAAGKLSFFALLVWSWLTAALPVRAPLAGTADLVFGALFLVWLFTADAGAWRG